MNKIDKGEGGLGGVSNNRSLGQTPYLMTGENNVQKYFVKHPVI